VDPENTAGAAAAIGFSIGLPLALALMFWGLNFVPVVIAVPAMIACLVLPLAMLSIGPQGVSDLWSSGERARRSAPQFV
jgi:hypothetical protein